ncbi:LytTR family DNA-binding domain-containing protein [Phenylobacterium sp.]|jgi:DNA-binding LytR/AlgR family response regulator|uniref:LytR/AlgR family response regulator transcription factor n=1 Tax=Phenylobacterium sp. TaxID=1871053 RepID=UPI002F9577D2
MSAPLRIGLVDDEPPAIRRLSLALAEMPGVAVVGTAGDGAQALELIAAGGLDVVLLDIRMPGLSGLDLLRAVPREGAPVFVFVTAYSRFAAEAFELAAADYLLKPVEFERLRQAIDRARQTLASRAAAERISELEKVVAAMKSGTAEPPEGGWLTELWVPDRGERLRLPVQLIDWVEAERDYVRIHSRGRSFLIRKSIRDLEAELDPAAFLRVHRAALIRRDRVARIARRPGGLSTVILQSGAEVPVSRRLASRVRRLATGRQEQA